MCTCKHQPKGYSGRLVYPPKLHSGVWKPRGCIIRWALRPAFSNPSFINFTVCTHVRGSRWQFTPTMSAPGQKQTQQIDKFIENNVSFLLRWMYNIKGGRTSSDQPDSTLSWWDTLHVSMRRHAKCRSHWFTACFQYFHCPHCLFNMIHKL